MNRRIADRVDDALRRHRLPGLAVVVREGAREAFARGFGHLDPAASRPVSADSPFGVASLTKFVTASLVLLLQERGLLSLDDPVSRFYPSLAFAADGAVRVHHLLSHSAGLPGLPSRHVARDLEDAGDPSGGTERASLAAAVRQRVDLPPGGIVGAAELVELINRLEPVPLAAPGTLLSYSNEGYCLLGGVVEQLTGQSYAQAVREQVLAPLGMRRSFVGNEGLPAPDELALPLLRDGDRYRIGRFWQAPLFNPAGGLVCSARDVARLIGSLGDGHALLSAESRRLMMQPRMAVPSRPGLGPDAGSGPGTERGTGYGLGLEWRRVDARTAIAWHSGQRAGVSSFMAWVDEAQLAIAVLCQVAGAPVAAIGHALIGEWLGRSDIGWPPVGAVRDAPVGPGAAFAGRYGSGEVGVHVVEPAGNGWVLRTPASVDPEPLRFDSSASGVVGDQTFCFLGDEPASAPWALALDLRVLRSEPALGDVASDTGARSSR